VYRSASFRCRSSKMTAYGVPKVYTLGSAALGPGSFTCPPTPNELTCRGATSELAAAARVQPRVCALAAPAGQHRQGRRVHLEAVLCQQRVRLHGPAASWTESASQRLGLTWCSACTMSVHTGKRTGSCWTRRP